VSPLDILLPRTDAGVWFQLAILIVVGVAAFRLTRASPEGRLLVIGALFLGLGLFALRALH